VLREVALLQLERETGRVRNWIERENREAREWVDASVISSAAFWATPEEMAEVSEALRRLSERFTPRWDAPSTRPDRARVVRLFGATSVDAVSDNVGPDEHDGRQT
jgi:hypothetical protein